MMDYDGNKQTPKYFYYVLWYQFDENSKLDFFGEFCLGFLYLARDWPVVFVVF